MKKLNNIVLALALMVTHVIIELYPTIKRGIKIYANKLDFNSFLNSEHVADYISFLSEEEKTELVNMMSPYIKNTLD